MRPRGMTPRLNPPRTPPTRKAAGSMAYPGMHVRSCADFVAVVHVLRPAWLRLVLQCRHNHEGVDQRTRPTCRASTGCRCSLAGRRGDRLVELWHWRAVQHIHCVWPLGYTVGAVGAVALLERGRAAVAAHAAGVSEADAVSLAPCLFTYPSARPHSRTASRPTHP
eukprot:363326-Chlamydomonas_euryale.AAC.7